MIDDTTRESSLFIHYSQYSTSHLHYSVRISLLLLWREELVAKHGETIGEMRATHLIAFCIWYMLYVITAVMLSRHL